MSFVTYTLTVPKATADLYVEHVLKKIYGLTEQDLKVFEGEATDDTSLLSENDDEYVIQHHSWNYTALCNVLPLVTVDDISHLTVDKDLCDEISWRIDMFFSPKDRACRFNKVRCEPNQITPIIEILVHQKVIQKYVSYDTYGSFLCVCDNIPIYIGIKDGILKMKKVKDIVFDIDDGFSPDVGLDDLNKQFQAWKRRGDLTAPIITNSAGRITKRAY